jgi:hypothetical protein
VYSPRATRWRCCAAAARAASAASAGRAATSACPHRMHPHTHPRARARTHARTHTRKHTHAHLRAGTQRREGVRRVTRRRRAKAGCAAGRPGFRSGPWRVRPPWGWEGLTHRLLSRYSTVRSSCRPMPCIEPIRAFDSEIVPPHGCIEAPVPVPFHPAAHGFARSKGLRSLSARARLCPPSLYEAPAALPLRAEQHAAAVAAARLSRRA